MADRTPDDKAQDDEQHDDKKQNDKKPAPVSGAEWAMAALGLALVATVVALLVREAVGSAHRPPDVTVTADSVVQGRGGWLVLFTARNAGDATAAMLTLRATHAAGADTVERDAQIDYLPARSERKGGFVFPRDPRAGVLRLEALGYEEP